MQVSEVVSKTKWLIDSFHSEIGFRVKHLMLSNVRGEFKEYSASIYTTGDDFRNAEIDLWINPASINTGDAARDTHLKAVDFFNVKKFNEIIFKGKNFEATGYEMYVLYGDLTMKGITKSIRLSVELSGVAKDPWGGQRAGFTVTGKINRKDWGLTWSALMESGGVVAGEEIFIKCEIELVKQPE